MLSSSDCLSDTEYTKDDNQVSHFVDKYIAVKLTDEHEYSHTDHCLKKTRLGERFLCSKQEMSLRQIYHHQG